MQKEKSFEKSVFLRENRSSTTIYKSWFCEFFFPSFILPPLESFQRKSSYTCTFYVSQLGAWLRYKSGCICPTTHRWRYICIRLWPLIPMTIRHTAEFVRFSKTSFNLKMKLVKRRILIGLGVTHWKAHPTPCATLFIGTPLLREFFLFGQNRNSNFFICKIFAIPKRNVD